MKTTSIKLLLAFTLISLSTIASAQLRVGPIAGVNLSNIAGDHTDDNAMKLGFHFGAMVELPITDNFIINPGVLYSMKGTQSDSLSDYKFNLSYIEIPINAKYRMESGLNFFAGPYLGFLMTSEATDGNNTVDFKDFTESMDFGLNIGLGFDMDMGLGISAQYGLGLANINKDRDLPGIDTPSNTNSTIGISIRYMFGGE